MNKFITLALFAICATMAHGQVVLSGPYGLQSSQLNQQSGSGASSSSAASASSSTAAANNQNALISSSAPTLISPVGPSYGSLLSPYVSAPIVNTPYLNTLNALNAGPIVAGSQLIPQGYANQLVTPLLAQQYPIGAIGPCGQGVLTF